MHQLLVLGCNDSFLPASLPVNSFIPQSLRRDLGLWTDEDRAVGMIFIKLDTCFKK